MPITVKFFANFREAADKKQEKVDGVDNIASLLNDLSKRFGEKMAGQLYAQNGRELNKAVNILVNGKGITSTDISLKDGDVVTIFPPVSGGS